MGEDNIGGRDYPHYNRNFPSVEDRVSDLPRDRMNCHSSKEEIYGIDAAVDYAGISKRKLYRLAIQGNIPCVKMGGKWRFKKEILDIFFRK